MHPTPGTPLHRLALLLTVLLTAAACAGGPVTRDGGFYAVDLPGGWVVVDDGDAHQVAAPGSDTPMTIRIVTSEDVDDLRLVTADLREGTEALGADARVVGEEALEVPGAAGARSLTTETTLEVAATGETLTVRTVDVLARTADGRLVVVKVQGPAETFDEAVLDAVLGSLTVRGDTA